MHRPALHSAKRRIVEYAVATTALTALVLFQFLRFNRSIFYYQANNAYHAQNLLQSTKRYRPAETEQYAIDNAEQLGFTAGQVNDQTKPSCSIFHHHNVTPHYHTLRQYVTELATYGELLQNFQPISDIRRKLDDSSNEVVCKALDLIPGGLSAVFRSGQLSWTAGGSGFVEPLLPPLRHPLYCLEAFSNKNLLRLDYLVHDFRVMCESLKRHSRIILVDMGASLEFHTQQNQTSPAMFLIDLYRRFGFPFDHIYAYEIFPTEPFEVFVERLPLNLRSAYHWINVGVSAEPGNAMNPLSMVLDSFDEDDFVVVKLDIDTPSIEIPLVHQLLEDERLVRLVDQFYFEHHVNQRELASSWKTSMKGSIKESLDLFQGLRKKGVAAHYWV